MSKWHECAPNVGSCKKVAGGCPASLRHGHWLDLYNRTGFVGIEAINRGCSKIWMSVGKDGPFDYISVTSPYAQVDYGVLMDHMLKSALIGKGIFIVVEYHIRTYMMESCGCLVNVLSSVCNPSVTVYKCYGLLKETEEYLNCLTHA
ncbi:hypothetical protein Ddye_013178 [Dipteronia dyeriana]|uniref:Uncharacterized protein n=1 Tax=Dipteronia dyeriana TaxID=168575 RepID=A0AAE0CJC6_9ROSI|nr:hypothetical protein Ddye_013178 [Dipteronia dyeriana]